MVLGLVGMWGLYACNPPVENESESTKASVALQAVADSGATVRLTQEQFRQAGLGLGRFERKSTGATLSVNGQVDVPPQSRISVSFPYGGFVREIKVLEGAFVEKGQLLAVLENPAYVDLQEQYLKNKSALEYAGQEYERQRQLFEADVAAGKSFQRATRDFHGLQATVKALSQKLALLGLSPEALTPASIVSSVKVLAPASGYITQVTANKGKYMDARAPLMVLNDASDMLIDLTVYEKDVMRVQPGQRLIYYLADDTQAYEGSVNLIGREVRADRSVVVHALPGKRVKNLIPGTFVHATIQLDHVLSEVLPSEALVRSGDRSFVFILQQVTADSSYLFQMLPVKRGNEQDGYVQATLNGPRVNDLQVVTKGAFSLLSVLKNEGDDD